MKNKIFKRNKISNIKNNGFVVLYTMILASIILAIAMGILRIALKEANFSVSARAGNEAFFAADTGVECALFYDKSDPTLNVFSGTLDHQMKCAGQNIVVSSIGSLIGSGSWSFEVRNLGESGKACADVTLIRDIASNTTTIISTGYNNCYTNSGVAVRELKVTY